MWAGMTAAANTALQQSHSMAARITITSPGYQRITLPISDGTVTYDASSQTRRTATLTCDPALWPNKPTDMLAPWGSYGYIEYGIGLSNGTYFWVPLGRFYLTQTERQRPIQSNSGLTVTLQDQQSRIAEDRAQTPLQTVSGATCVAEISRIIKLTDPDIVVTDLTGDVTVAPQIIISQDKWQDGIEKLADAIGAEVFTSQDGNGFIIRYQPTLTSTPVWSVRTGPGANLVQSQDTVTRAGVYNVFVISGTRADGTTPVQSIVQDTDPNSPTYVNGLFGRRTRYYYSALLKTVPQCTKTGQAFLDRVKGFSVNPVFQQLVNPALDAGDVILYYQDDKNTGSNLTGIPVLLSKVVTPLGPDKLQELDGQVYQLPDESQGPTSTADTSSTAKGGTGNAPTDTGANQSDGL